LYVNKITTKKFGYFNRFLLLLTGCLNELDNYDAPDGGIMGRILDAETNEPVPLPVQGSTGTIINLYELNFVSPCKENQ
jgi:hypothetical protein